MAQQTVWRVRPAAAREGHFPRVSRALSKSLVCGSAALLLVGDVGVRAALACGSGTNMTDERGTVTHAAPLAATKVRIGDTQVVLVPFWDASKRRPGLLARARYTLVNPGRRTIVRLGVAERKALIRTTTEGMGEVSTDERVWATRGDLSLVARSGGRLLGTHGYPGVGRNGWWHAFSLEAPARGRVLLETVSTSRLGFRYQHHNAHGFPRGTRGQGSGGQESWYSLRYSFGGRRAWATSPGAVVIRLYASGALHQLRRLTRRPRPKDDLGMDLLRTEDMEEACPQRGRCQTVDRLKLVSASDYQASKRLDTHPALAVDGDPRSQWVGTRGRALRSYLQLPSRADRDLVGLRITPGPRCAGCARPARLAVRCVTAKRRVLIATARLPDRAGAHLVTLAKHARCAAVRLTPLALHGPAGHSVVIAEVEQRFRAGAGTGFRKTAAPRLTDPYPAGPRRPVVRGTAGAFDVATVDDVRWSGDGALLHYRLHLENARPPVTGVRLGYIVQAATGRVKHIYRLDRAGVLPAPYRAHWARAIPYDAGMTLVKKYGLSPARAARVRPRGPARGRRALILWGQASRRLGRYLITPTRHGFRWLFIQGYKRRRARVIRTTLELAARGGRRLVRRAMAFDSAFARRHARVWWARRRFFAAVVKKHEEDQKAMGRASTTSSAAKLAELWHLRTYRYSQAYSGDVLTYWHPRGRAVAVFWIDRRDLSGRQPIPAPKNGDMSPWIPKCAGSIVGVCAWERRDEPKLRVTLTLHSLAPAVAPRRPARP